LANKKGELIMKQSEKLRDEVKALRQKTDEDIDYSDIPATGEDWFKTAELALELTPGQSKEKISMFIDREVLDFFRRSGNGYQTRMNAVLRLRVGKEKTTLSHGSQPILAKPRHTLYTLWL
jgi:uncharacterized protein (DUF4415 family)